MHSIWEQTVIARLLAPPMQVAPRTARTGDTTDDEIVLVSDADLRLVDLHRMAPL
jgi:hypothetical protein